MLSKITKKILLEKPGLAELLNKHGQSSVLEYVKNRNINLPILPERKQQLIETIVDEIKQVLPKKIAEAVATHLNINYYANTTDHLGPLAHPFFICGNLADSLANKNNEPVIITLACSGVSLNNSSLPRALLFHNQDLNEVRLRFFSLKHRHATVYAAPAYTPEVVTRLIKEIPKIKLKPELLQKLKKIFTESFGLSQVVNLKNYSQQLSLANYHLWKLIPGQENATLIYLDLEKITASLIIKHHLFTPTPIQQIILNHKAHRLFSKYFDNIPGAFSTKTHKGTFLFWGLNDKGEHVELHLINNQLISHDHKIEINIDAHSIAQAVEQRRLMPSLALCLIILNSYYGLTCGGGFSQVDYLPQLNKAYYQLLRDLAIADPDHQPVLADTLGGDFSFITVSDQRRNQLATAIDLILYNKKDTVDKFNKLAASVSIKEAVTPLFPYFYHILTPGANVIDGATSLPPCLYV